MSNAARDVEFEALLSSTGWELERLVQGRGLMATSRASLGIVRRKSDRAPGFAKCIWEAIERGGETYVLAGPTRLGRLHERLSAIARMGDLPVAKIMEASIHRQPRCLLVIMEPVATFSRLISDGVFRDEVAALILERFNPAVAQSGDWLHFDICPANAGLDSQGLPVLIDLESVYIASSSEPVDVSFLAAKWFRSPRGLQEDLVDRAHRVQPTGDLGLFKHLFEVIFLAAEVSMGQLAPGLPGDAAAEDWVLNWFAALESVEPLRGRVAFWRKTMISALDRSSVPDLASIASELRRTIGGGDRTSSPIQQISMPLPEGKMDHRGGRMRRDQLDPEQLVAYFNDVLAEARGSDTVAAWFEACTVSVCYLKNKELALSVVQEASRCHPDHLRLKKWTDMIGLWAADGSKS